MYHKGGFAKIIIFHFGIKTEIEIVYEFCHAALDVVIRIAGADGELELVGGCRGGNVERVTSGF